MCLIHHPDKMAQSTGGEADDTLFKNIQKGTRTDSLDCSFLLLAYETLSNPKTKRAYDSKDPFDDSIPSYSDITCDEDFYEVFHEVFTRNAKYVMEFHSYSFLDGLSLAHLRSAIRTRLTTRWRNSTPSGTRSNRGATSVSSTNMTWRKQRIGMHAIGLILFAFEMRVDLVAHF